MQNINSPMRANVFAQDRSKKISQQNLINQI